jgi:2OG-Fe(II) oxygenase superfamily
MLQISSADVVSQPFPHVIKQGILAPSFFAELKAAFPDAGVFKDQSSAHGAAGSRTGSGYDLYRGDGAFSNLTGQSKAWKAFSDYINSEAFADTFREVFSDSLDSIGLRVDIRNSHVDPSYVEPRALLTETATLGDRVAMAANALIDPFRPERPTPLFTRLDIHRSLVGYMKPAHCDRPNRLCSLIVYFTDADKVGLEGGDLTVYAHKTAKPVGKYERHPEPDAVTQIAQLRPKENLGVFFPCQNNSYHGVTPVLSNGIPRDFLYINISGRARSLW